MISLSKSLAIVLTGAIGLAALPGTSAADNYPSRPITMIVPFGAGGGTDIIARTVSDDLSKALGQSIVVEARPGANGSIGSAVVARAAPDGYTLLFTAQSTYSLNPNLMKAPLLDQLKDLVPVASIGRSPWLIAVQAESAFKSIADVVAYGKANPGKLVFPFWQSSVLVTAETFARAGDFSIRKAPYKGQVEATTDFLGGRLPIMVTDIAGGRAPVEAGKMRLLATTTAKRTQAFPDVPTMREQGLDVVTDSMLAVFAPAGTPQPILDKLNAELTKIILTSDKVRDRLRQLGLEPTAMTQAEADAFVRSEMTRWAEMIQRAGLQKE
ncbi:Bug family tripartite tricarboxylate transporter substrate binding protein [Chelatococcus asaccharovorans]|uniref:Tripartite-type tricarboxylate transporter receptor subunit TctC n=1 Tax=Chelatococcus asaccharovorans TaxID=28210 RepID=A0A2V3UEW3_9HYPH|nr:tripartite tricarboxylate transporter substrate binding protein [Chelatococcus asaccharovorans]MBS7707236.1 tripartite tricarboxylate transporter substrate binding protein [Chelatococcus asaccharovorans]PXW63418.1 tripartite-type tricarboxylate transporter receptor subunit TctC [Chelatococcus asaccharovorans]